MAFPETILLPMKGDVPDNVESYKRVQNIPDRTKIKVYSGKSQDSPYVSTVIDSKFYDNYFVLALENDLNVDTNNNIIAEVDSVPGIVERNSKIESSKGTDINFSKIDAAENEFIKAVRDASASFKEKINALSPEKFNTGGTRRRRRSRKNKQ